MQADAEFCVIHWIGLDFPPLGVLRTAIAVSPVRSSVCPTEGQRNIVGQERVIKVVRDITPYMEGDHPQAALEAATRHPSENQQISMGNKLAPIRKD